MYRRVDWMNVIYFQPVLTNTEILDFDTQEIIAVGKEVVRDLM